MNREKGKPKVGLLNKDALGQLRKDIIEELGVFQSKSPSRAWVCRVLSLSNQNALVTWRSVFFSTLYGLILFTLFLLDDAGPECSRYLLPLQAITLWIFSLLNVLLVYNEYRLSLQEIPNRVWYALEELEKAAEECKWKEENYPHLCAPFSPCVTLQWTYRDGKLVNLPWSLLVQGDAVMIKPGQESPGHCKTVENPEVVLVPRQIYQPANATKDAFNSPRATHPHKNKLFVMTETPYLSNLRLALEKALDRPITVHNKQRHLVFIKCIEGVVLPISVVLCLMIGVLLGHWRGSHTTVPWSQVFILPTVAATLPLLSLAYPIVWTALNIYAMSKFKHVLQSSCKHHSNRSGSISEELSKPLMTNYSLVNKTSVESFVSLWKTSVNILRGKENLVSRSANIVHVLGSVTALCCVDKKGILSWPNPTAEKVFFLRNSSSLSPSSSKSSCGLDSGGQSGDGTNAGSGDTNHGSNTAIPHVNPTTVAEVLDLTHDQNIPFKLEFDDHSWKNHLSCLKPLGLAILLNTCNMDTQEHYTNFCSHLTCEATQSEDVVPVTNRRCLCELAKQIGFVEEAKNIYTLQTPIATFRHLPPDVIRRDTRFARSLHLNTRVKVPLPHMLGTIIRDQAGGLQLITQGTADIILDSCSEFWNGQDLCLLSPSDRKKVLDFYQRSSLTAYCSAFAYRPLTRGVSLTLSALYLELPADCRSLYPPTPGWSEPHPPLTSHYLSTDSLLFNDLKEEDVVDVEGYFDVQCNQVFIGMVTMQYQAQSDMVELIERLDKACIRFVHFSKENELRSRVFSEKMGLESGWNCHISLSSDDRAVSPTTSQNLPTPLCSEKGWKGGSGATRPKTATRGDSFGEEGHTFLHSSLEGSKALSNSAPGAINLEHSTVKFDNETSHMRYSTRDDSIVSQTQQGIVSPQTGNKSHNESNRRISQDSVLLGGWEGAGDGAEGCRSLSCLTDSTDHSAPVNFDMRNRAKLPRGIDNIRPHIEQVDNVPLLVSLFTDCTASTARRMLEIMQDYAQVVCVMGSAANKDNMEIFMQADASIAVEPLYPVLCQKMPPYQLPEKGMGPIDLARTLNSVPCSISVTREADVSLFSLVTLARHLMSSLWSASQYWLSAVCTILFLQMLTLVCGVPQILSVGSVLWLSLVVVPGVSVALTLAPLDSSVMANATNKLHTTITFKMCMFAMWCYGYKFLPSIVIILVSYVTLLRSFCENIVQSCLLNATAECIHIVYPKLTTHHNHTVSRVDGDVWVSWEKEYGDGYMMAQQMAFFMTTTLFLAVSISFVYRDYSLWKKNVVTNSTWTGVIIILFIVQLLYWSAVCLIPDDLNFKYPPSHIVVIFTSPLLIIVLNEGIKWQEIKVNLRYQRRARLDFGTKLGMNSPF